MAFLSYDLEIEKDQMNFLSFNSDLSLNYINGSIPSIFSQLPLVIL